MIDACRLAVLTRNYANDVVAYQKKVAQLYFPGILLGSNLRTLLFFSAIHNGYLEHALKSIHYIHYG